MRCPVQPSLPEYSVRRFRNRYRVIRWQRDGVISVGDAVGEFDTFEDARKEMYRLNGWKYKPKNSERI
jgi:hypothetical protein